MAVPILRLPFLYQYSNQIQNRPLPAPRRSGVPAQACNAI